MNAEGSFNADSFASKEVSNFRRVLDIELHIWEELNTEEAETFVFSSMCLIK